MMQVWMIRDNGCTGAILDIVTSAENKDAIDVIDSWRNTYVGVMYASQYPQAHAFLAYHIK